jgi:hypothetical protein
MTRFRESERKKLFLLQVCFMRPSWKPLLPYKCIAIIFAAGTAVTVALALLGLANAALWAGIATIFVLAILCNGSV